MKPRTARRARPALVPAITDLVDLRDDLASARDMTAAAHMACHALAAGSSERAALCEVTNTCREKLEAVVGRLDKMLADASRQASQAPPVDAPTRVGRRKRP